MANDSDVIKEFLVALSFKIDEAGAKKFRTGLGETTLGVMKLGGAVIAVGIAIEQFVAAMAEGLSKLYYISERTGASVAGLKATESAFQGIGLQAGVATQAIEAVGDQLRKPWLTSRLQGLGINTNQPTEKVASDIEHMLAGMWNQGGGQRQVAEEYAKTFLNMDEHNFVQLVKELPELDKQAAIAAQRIAESGQNFDDAAKKAAEFKREMGAVGQDISALGAKWLNLNKTMNKATEIVTGIEHLLHAALTGDLFKSHGRVEDPNDPEHLHDYDTDPDYVSPSTGASTTPAQAETGASTTPAQAELIAKAAEAAVKYGLDPKRYQAQIMQESGYNPAAKSDRGAVGVAQFMPDTARKGQSFEPGVDPVRDLFEGARFMRQIMDSHPGMTQRDAERYYNAGDWGAKPGTLGYSQSMQYNADIDRRMNDSRLGGSGPAARGFGGHDDDGSGDRVFAPSITNNFQIHGDDASSIGRTVHEVTNRGYGDLTRDGNAILSTPGRG